MSNNESRREKRRAEKRAAKAHRMSRPGAKSNYARKSEYLKAYNRRKQADELAHLDHPKGRVWGFDFPIGEKPWVSGGA